VRRNDGTALVFRRPVLQHLSHAGDNGAASGGHIGHISDGLGI
jgi:hypothetical protein